MHSCYAASALHAILCCFAARIETRHAVLQGKGADEGVIDEPGSSFAERLQKPLAPQTRVFGKLLREEAELKFLKLQSASGAAPDHFDSFSRDGGMFPSSVARCLRVHPICCA